MSIHRSGGCGCGDGALSQIGLIHDGGEQRGIRRCVAFLSDAAAAAVNRCINSREGEGFPRRGGLAQG